MAPYTPANDENETTDCVEVMSKITQRTLLHPIRALNIKKRLCIGEVFGGVIAILTAFLAMAYASYTNRAGFTGRVFDTNRQTWCATIACFSGAQLCLRIFRLRRTRNLIGLGAMDHAKLTENDPDVPVCGGRCCLSVQIIYFFATALTAFCGVVAFAMARDLECMTLQAVAFVCYTLSAFVSIHHYHRESYPAAYLAESPLLGSPTSPRSGGLMRDDSWHLASSSSTAFRSSPNVNSATPIIAVNAESSGGASPNSSSASPTGAQKETHIMWGTRCGTRTAMACNWCFRMAFFLFGVGVLMGGFIAGKGFAYQPCGSFAPNVGDFGYDVLYRCEGNRASPDHPVFMIDADASHGAADFWPLQAALKAAGMRSCIFDKPGLGYSSWYDAKQDLQDLSNFYADMINKFGEKPPYSMIGWGGGATNVWKYTLSQKSGVVSSVLLLDGYRGNIEWRQHYAYERMTSEAALKDYRQSQLDDRFDLFHLIRGFGVPWGIMAPLLGSNRSAYADPERYDEYRWFYLTGKTWTTQYFTLRSMAAHGECGDGSGPLSTCPLWSRPEDPAKRNIRVVSLVSDPPDASLCQHTRTAAACEKAKFGSAFQVQDAVNLTKAISQNGTVVYCKAFDCKLDMPLRMPEMVVDAIKDEGLDRPV